MDLGAIQQALGQAGLDGWLFFDFRGSDPLGSNILGLPKGSQTRRWFYYLPQSGEPVKIVHAIEAGALDALPGSKRVYLRWEVLHAELRKTLENCGRIAMQYSPQGAIPYIGRVDAGTMELVRSIPGVEVATSADLVQQFEATISEEQFESHAKAADLLGQFVTHCFNDVGRRIDAGVPVTEYDIQQVMLQKFADSGLITDHDPIVAVNANSANPHYAPTSDCHEQIRLGDFVLIDTWAKFDAPGSIFADITWTGFVGPQVPEKIQEIFDIVIRARDTCLNAVIKAQREGSPLRGCDADDICRAVIEQAGYGEYYIHRTGHSIHVLGHGNGANLDNVETRDERRLIPRTCFSIEPGIYFPGEFGVRSEIDVFLPDAQTAIVTGPEPQQEIVLVDPAAG